MRRGARSLSTLVPLLSVVNHAGLNWRPPRQAETPGIRATRFEPDCPWRPCQGVGAMGDDDASHLDTLESATKRKS